MNLSYEKLGTDHKMYGKVEYLVMDGTQEICYKNKDGYISLESDGKARLNSAKAKQDKAIQRVNSLFVLSFKINDEEEEMTFKSKTEMDKTIAFYKEKEFITDFETTEYKLA